MDKASVANTSFRRIQLLDLAGSALGMIPEAARIAQGLLGLATLLPNSKQSLGRLFEIITSRQPNHIAVLDGDKAWTYHQLNARANQLARFLSVQGVKAGDSVGILMENRPETLICVLGVVKLGAVAAMLNHQQRGQVLTHSIGLVKPAAMIVGRECEDTFTTLEQPFDKTVVIYPDDKSPDASLTFNDVLDTHSKANPATTPQVKASQPCFYIFTSGTTGLPKASVMSHYRWLAVSKGLGTSIRLNKDDIFYCCLPLYHNNALSVSWGCVLSAGATLALDRKFSASRFWERIRFYHATAFCYIGELLRYLLNQPAHYNDQNHEVRVIMGNGLRPELWKPFVERFGIPNVQEFYGSSESNIGFINAFGLSETVGFTPMPFAVVACDAATEQPVRNAKGRMVRVKAGEVGLLISQVSPRRPFDGYTDKAASEKKLLRDVFRKGDCWFNSGDLVRKQGWQHIQFVDRLGDTFRWKGENVATSEVEGVLAQIPWIAHGCVYGVQVPGADGRAGMASITLQTGASFDGKQLAQRFIQALPAYAVPLFVRLRQEQDTTGTFKYKKNELKQEGFNPQTIGEPLYVMIDKGYQPVTLEVFTQICEGQIRL